MTEAVGGGADVGDDADGPSGRHTDFFVGATVPTPPVPDDDGSASEPLLRALEGLGERPHGASDVLQALSAARLFVPVLAVLEDSETGADGVRQEKTSTMAAVLVDSAEHGRAQLAFSSITALTSWNRQARPVPVMAPVAARAAVAAPADALLVDISGPVPFALTGAELLLMASLARPSPGEPDVVLLRAAVDAVHRTEPNAEVRLDEVAPGRLRLVVAGVEDESSREQVLRQLSADRVLGRVMVGDLRVVFGDTP